MKPFLQIETIFEKAELVLFLVLLFSMKNSLRVFVFIFIYFSILSKTLKWSIYILINLESQFSHFLHRQVTCVLILLAKNLFTFKGYRGPHREWQMPREQLVEFQLSVLHSWCWLWVSVRPGSSMSMCQTQRSRRFQHYGFLHHSWAKGWTDSDVWGPI